MRRSVVSCAIVSLAIVLSALSQAAGQNPGPRFASEVTWVGQGVDSCQSGDLNRDGRPDLVTAGSFRVNVLLGDGSGRLEVSDPIQVGGEFGPLELVVSDINGDGAEDAAVAGGGHVHLLQGDNSGALALTASVPLPGAKYITAGDVDGDGRSEILVSNGTSGVQVFNVSPLGALTVAAPIAVPGTATVLDLADASGDGRLDLLVIAKNPSQFVVRNGLGAGAFGPASTVSLPADGSALSLSDVNGDQILDAFVATPNAHSAQRLFGLGGGAFGAAKSIALGESPYNMVLADVTGDSKLDLVGAFGGLFRIRDGVGTSGNFLAGDTIRLARHNTYVTPVDLNGDLWMDLVVASGYSVTVILGGDDGLWTSAHASIDEIYTTNRGAFADLDGDGDPDAMSLRLTSSALPPPSAVDIWLVDGNGQMGAPTVASLPGIVDPVSLRAAWINGDSDVDLFVHEGFRVFPMLGNGSGDLIASAPVVVGFQHDGTASANGDFDGDGDEDLLFHDVPGQTFDVYFNDGAGGFSPGPTTHQVLDARPGFVNDIDGDGIDDVIVENDAFHSQLPNSMLRVYRGSPTGTFSEFQVIDLAPDQDVRRLAVGDLDGDGDRDLVASLDTFTFVVYLGTPGGLFGVPPHAVDLQPTSASTQGMEIADVNADGFDDLLQGNQSVVTVAMGGPGALLNDVRRYFIPHDSVFDLSLAHPTGSARPEILVAGKDLDKSAGALTILSQRCDRVVAAFGLGCPGTAGASPRLALRGCVEMGEEVEIRVENAVGGAVALLLLGTDEMSSPIVPSCDLVIGSLLPVTIALPLAGTGPGEGAASFPFAMPQVPVPVPLSLQVLVPDSGVGAGFSATNGVTLSDA